MMHFLIMRVARSYLEEANYAVIADHYGQDALFLTREEKPNLIVLDSAKSKMNVWSYPPDTRRVRGDSDNFVDSLDRGSEPHSGFGTGCG